MIRRIEAEDLQPGDVFEYEFSDYAYHVSTRSRTWLPTKMKRDTVRKLPATCDWVINNQSTNPDCLGGGFFTREEAAARPGLYLADWTENPREPGKFWCEPGQRFENAVYVLTEVGWNNHGYVILPPKTVVLLIERSGES